MQYSNVLKQVVLTSQALANSTNNIYSFKSLNCESLSFVFFMLFSCDGLD